mgnify:FL=1|tara:strand:+ start:9547 stop:9717 length:171 start_codon:yes stop_codon:yes gene_type:complete
MSADKIKDKVSEEQLWNKYDIVVEALDKIITTHADSGTLKKIAKQAIQDSKLKLGK